MAHGLGITGSLEHAWKTEAAKSGLESDSNSIYWNLPQHAYQRPSLHPLVAYRAGCCKIRVRSADSTAPAPPSSIALPPPSTLWQEHCTALPSVDCSQDAMLSRQIRGQYMSSCRWTAASRGDCLFLILIILMLDFYSLSSSCRDESIQNTPTETTATKPLSSTSFFVVCPSLSPAHLWPR